MNLQDYCCPTSVLGNCELDRLATDFFTRMKQMGDFLRDGKAER